VRRTTTDSPFLPANALPTLKLAWLLAIVTGPQDRGPTMQARLLPTLLLLPVFLPLLAGAQTYRESTLVSFPSITNGPVLPAGGLIIDAAGDLYGSAQGGVNNLGAIFKVTPRGVVSVLHSFSGTDGSYPAVNLIRDRAGNLYGATSQGGAGAGCPCGTVFKLTPEGDLTVLYSFTGGYAYASALTLDAAGSLYGFEFATNANGSVFKVMPDGSFSVVYSFCALSNCADGASPVGSLIENKAGNFYGTTNRGGQFNQGTVFELTPEYVESVLYSFTGGSDGGNPVGKLTQDAAGNMYGVTYAGGTASNAYGTLFKITPAGVESVLYSFCQLTDCADGARPAGSVVLDTLGNLYGTTILGGTYNAGVVFKVTPAGAESVLQDLTTAADGGNGAVLDKVGNVYVEIYAGGKSGEGSVVKLTKHADVDYH
jgi:uncharacterized repeat protein (TIGR03803 family)